MPENTLRTQDEIIERIQNIQRGESGADYLGFRREVLVDALDFEHARPWLTADTTAEQWGTTPTYDAVHQKAVEYYQFALQKIKNHRGISANRSVDKLTEFAWLLKRDDVVSTMQSTAYEQYGAPIVKAFAAGLGLPWPDDEDLARMAAGEPCRPDCDEGCGQ